MSENLREQLILLPAYFQGHILLTLAAISMGILVSVPLGVWAEQSARVKRPLLAVVSIIQTFPSLAILALVVALLGGRIGFLPAFIALTLYSMLPIVRNTVTGIVFGDRGGEGYWNVAKPDTARSKIAVGDAGYCGWSSNCAGLDCWLSDTFNARGCY